MSHPYPTRIHPAHGTGKWGPVAACAPRTRRALGCTAWLAVHLACAQAQNPPAPPALPAVGPVPTPQAVVDKMLELAELKTNDVLYDLGCGDGRILVTAAKRYGIKAVGFDIDPACVRASLANAKSNRVDHLVTVKQADVFTLDLREATVVTLYLLPELNVRLMPQLEQLRPGARILSHDFDMRGAIPESVHRMRARSDPPGGTTSLGLTTPALAPPPPPPVARTHTIYKWTVPWRRETEASGSDTQ